MQNAARRGGKRNPLVERSKRASHYGHALGSADEDRAISERVCQCARTGQGIVTKRERVKLDEKERARENKGA